MVPTGAPGRPRCLSGWPNPWHAAGSHSSAPCALRCPLSLHAQRGSCHGVCESFGDTGLKPEVLRGIRAQGFEEPSDVQQRAIILLITSWRRSSCSLPRCRSRCSGSPGDPCVGRSSSPSKERSSHPSPSSARNGSWMRHAISTRTPDHARRGLHQPSQEVRLARREHAQPRLPRLRPRACTLPWPSRSVPTPCASSARDRRDSSSPCTCTPMASTFYRTLLPTRPR